MYFKDSSLYRRIDSWTTGVVLALVIVAGLLSSDHLAFAGKPAADVIPARAGSQATQQTYNVYLPSTLRYYPNNTTIFGVQIYELLDSPKAGLDFAKPAGVTWIRWPIAWRWIEPQNTTPDKFYWTATDNALTEAARIGAKVILTIDGNPSWAAKYRAGPIDRAPLNEFAQFMGAVVERYDGDGYNDVPGSAVVNHFEFYNEPDGGSITQAELGIGYWGDFGVPYAKMLCNVAPAMKAADPNAKILLGGIAYDYFREENGPFVREFLDNVLAAGGGNCLDYLVFHYYPAFDFRWAPYGPGISGKAAFLRTKLAQYGVGDLPLMVTESGFFSNPNPAWPSSERLQATFVVKIFAQAIASDIKALTWWSWTDLPDYPDAYGLMTTDLRQKEAYFAFQTAVNKMGATDYQRTVSASELGGSDVEAYLFHTPKPLYVLWSRTNTTQLTALPGNRAELWDLLNNSLGLVTDEGDGQADGSILLKVGPTPMYVEIVE